MQRSNLRNDKEMNSSQMNSRVVITGIGVVAPNGTGVADFTNAIKRGKSGIQYFKELKDLNFHCCYWRGS